ncbi:hypothetical protein BSL78_12466, partial [Apostichopus japonicus]
MSNLTSFQCNHQAVFGKCTSELEDSRMVSDFDLGFKPVAMSEGQVRKAKTQKPEKDCKNDPKNDRLRKRTGMNRQSNSPPSSPRGNSRNSQVNGSTRPNSQEQLSDASSHSRTGSGYM